MRYLAVVVATGSLFSLSSGCQQRKQRPSAVIKPAQDNGGNKGGQPNGGGAGGGGGGGAGPQTPGGSGDAATYLNPVPRPAKIKDANGAERATNEHDIFVTPVYIKQNAWFKNCVIGAVGTEADRLFGCSQPEIPRIKNETALGLKTSYGIPLSSGGQKCTLEFRSFKPQVKKCSEIPDKQSKSTTESCPGEMGQTPFATRRSSDAQEHMLCTKVGTTLVIAYEDQDDAAEDGSGMGLFQKYKAAKTSLTVEGGAKAWVFPDVKKLFSIEVTGASFKSAQGAVVTEEELRKKYGVDFVDVILQIDLGTSGNTLAGFENCQ